MNSDSIGDLILQELRLIREEMKDEIRRLCNSIQSLHNEKPNQTFLNTKQDIPSHPANLLRLEYNLNDQNHQAKAHHLPKSTNVLLECNNTFSNEHCERTNLDKFKLHHSQPKKFEFGIQNEKKLFVEEMIEQERFLKRETPDEAVALSYPVVVDVKSVRESTQRVTEFSSVNVTKLQRNKNAKMCSRVFVKNKNDFADVCNGKKLYRCVICNKTVSTKSNLTKHYRIHSGEKNHKCTICSKGFFSKSGLITHTRIHTGEKPFKCNFCHKTFSVKSNLTKHTRIHRKEYLQSFI